MNKLTKEDLTKLENSKKVKSANWIKVGMGSCGVAAGADVVYNTLVDECKKRNIQIEIAKCGCLGMCSVEPLVEVSVEGLPSVIYGKVDKDVAIKILEKHVCTKLLVNDNIYELNIKE
jgi:(2Fe-2S) ferredoxin